MNDGAGEARQRNEPGLDPVQCQEFGLATASNRPVPSQQPAVRVDTERGGAVVEDKGRSSKPIGHLPRCGIPHAPGRVKAPALPPLNLRGYLYPVLGQVLRGVGKYAGGMLGEDRLFPGE
jgi:hypothetical protein